MSLFRRSRPDGERYIVVGLGNPGDRYARTRHNIGAMVVEKLLADGNVSLKSHKSGCLIAESQLGGERVVLARPTTYMNDSGRPVRELARWYKVAPDHLIVVHDEIDLPFSEVRVKAGGGTAGHNGLGSIVSHLGTKDFPRIRVGVGRPPGRKEAAGHVLNEFSAAERRELPDIIGRAADAVEEVLSGGVERAMNVYNTRA